MSNTPDSNFSNERAVALGAIRLDGGTQCRAALDMDHIEALVEAIDGGVSLPPLVVFHDGSDFWLGDGFHRYHAMQRLERREAWAKVLSGTRSDAIRYALSANSTHGLRRTNADKRRAVEIALKEFPSLSSQELSRVCAVSHVFVEKVRRVEQPEAADRVGRDGKVYPAPEKDEGEIAPSPVSYALAEKSVAPVHVNDGQAARVAQLAADDRAAKMPEIVQRARWCIQQVRSIGRREAAWMLASVLDSADYTGPRSILRSVAANRQGVVLPPAVLDVPVQWSRTHGLGVLDNLNQVAVLRALMDMHLECASEIVLERGADSDAADFIRWVLDVDVLGFMEETPAGQRELAALAEDQAAAA